MPCLLRCQSVQKRLPRLLEQATDQLAQRVLSN